MWGRFGIVLVAMSSMAYSVKHRHGALHRSGPAAVPKFKAALHFQQEIRLDLEIDGKSNGSRLVTRQHLNDTQPIGRKVKSSAVYMSNERDIIYREDVEVDGTITTYGLVRDQNMLLYFNGRGGMLELPVDFGARSITMIEPSPEAKLPEMRQKLSHSQRALLDYLSTPAVTQLHVSVHSSTIAQSFAPINDTNWDNIEADIRNFFTLVCNEMTIMYQSLSQYGNVYFRNGDNSVQQNIAKRSSLQKKKVFKLPEIIYFLC